MRAHYEEILRYCAWRLPNRQDAEDATQESFVKAMKYIGGLSGGRHYRAYLYKIAGSVCMDMLRRNKAEPLDTQYPYDEPGFLQVEAEDALLGRVQALPAPQREAVLLRYAQDLSVKEIAAVLDIPMRTVQSRLRLALNRLRGQDAAADSSGGTQP